MSLCSVILGIITTRMFSIGSIKRDVFETSFGINSIFFSKNINTPKSTAIFSAPKTEPRTLLIIPKARAFVIFSKRPPRILMAIKVPANTTANEIVGIRFLYSDIISSKYDSR